MEDYVVGSEMKIGDILGAADVVPLLKAMVAMGTGFASVTDEKGIFLFSDGDGDLYDTMQLSTSIIKDMTILSYEGSDWQLCPLKYEGGPIGFLFATIPDSVSKESLSRLMEIVSASLNILIRNSAKQITTTKMHDMFTYESYEELLETNKRLSTSEHKYRELAQNLEKRVEEKTAELKKATAKLLEQGKMAAVGQLAAGIAHEINNPMGFICSNLTTFEKYVKSLKEIIQSYRNTIEKFTDIMSQSAISYTCLESEELYKRLKIDFIIDDVSDLIQQNINGSERIKQIVINMKTFSHIDETANKMMDINEEAENTIKVINNEIEARSARIVTDYGKIPGFFGDPGVLCQVFLNVLLNALHSRDDNPIITIKTKQEKNNIIISIADNGKGIPPEIKERIFEPFFTTKDVGQGVGMGLAVVYEIVHKQGGAINVESKVGEGSNFIITLPLRD